MILDLLGNFARHGTGNNSVKTTDSVTGEAIKTFNVKARGPHKGELGLYCREIDHPMTAGATNTLTAALPDGASFLALTGIVTEASTAHNTREAIELKLDLGTDIVVASIALTSYCLVKGTAFSSTTTAAVYVPQMVAATDILIAPSSAGAGNMVASGRLRIQIWYLLATAPTA